MYRWFFLTLCTCSVFGYRMDYEFEDQLNDRQYDVGIPAISSTGTDKCKKDILLLVDTSYSIGPSHFNENVKPFLKNLVTNSLLNVRSDGTQVGLIIFSRTAEKLIDIGSITDAKKLSEEIDRKLDWEKVKGDHTRTDLGLEEANKIFQKNNPLNIRDNIDDVVIIVTDGEPRGKTNTVEETIKSAQKLKTKQILIVGAAVGSQRRQFKHILEKIATSSEQVVEAAFDDLSNIIGTLVAKSCIKPGQCTCAETSAMQYVKAGQTKAKVEWPNPSFSCSSGGEVVTESTVVEPPLTSPHWFSVGQHKITYTYKLKGDVTVVCNVTIVVKGELCRGKPFNSANQACCCGTIHDPVIPGYKCCGPDYYDSNTYQCCANANLISRQETCPIH